MMMRYETIEQLLKKKTKMDIEPKTKHLLGDEFRSRRSICWMRFTRVSLAF